MSEWSRCKSEFMKVCSAVNFRLKTMAAHDEFALKQNNPCFIGLGSVGASQPLHFDSCFGRGAAPMAEIWKSTLFALIELPEPNFSSRSTHQRHPSPAPGGLWPSGMLIKPI